MKKTIVQIVRAPEGGIRKHIIDILENIDQSKFHFIFISNFDECDVNLDSLRNFKLIEFYNVPVKDKPSFNDLLILFKIYFFLKKKNVNVIHGHGAKGGLYCRLLKWPLQVKTIYTPHGGSLHRVHGTLKNVLYDLIEKMLTPLTDVFLFESNYSLKMFKDNVVNPGNKAIVNPNGVALEEFSSENLYQKGNSINVASFGLLRHLKGHDIAVKAFKLLHEKEIPFTYSIYGEGEFKTDLLSLINEYKLNQYIKILPYSGNVPQEMRKYDFIFHPSRFESFGYVPVEAMALGVPVITSQEGGLKEVVTKETGLICESNTPEEYFELLSNIFHGKYDLLKLITQARTRIERNFSLREMVSRVQKIYDDLCNS